MEGDAVFSFAIDDEYEMECGPKKCKNGRICCAVTRLRELSNHHRLRELSSIGRRDAASPEMIDLEARAARIGRMLELFPCTQILKASQRGHALYCLVNPGSTWTIKMLYDGQCPLCSREAALLKRRNSLGRIAFEDITEPTFDPSRYGLTMPQLVASMHAVRPDGSVLKGIDVFAELYDAVGWTWLSRPLRWRLTRPLAKAGYRVFAAIRPRLSRFRPELCEMDRCSPTPERAESIH